MHLNMLVLLILYTALRTHQPIQLLKLYACFTAQQLLLFHYFTAACYHGIV